MKNIKTDDNLISMCGLYCGACKSFLKDRCMGCAENTKATWCKIRTCCLKSGYASCAECQEFSDPMDCNKFNNVFARVVGFFLNPDRRKGILMIKEKGRAGFAEHMASYGRVAIRRRG
jgi:hypothetical protein